MSALYQLAAVCPRCGWKPALYAYPAQVQSAAGHDPETPLLTVKCQNRECQHIYPLAADAFQRATRAPPRRERRAA